MISKSSKITIIVANSILLIIPFVVDVVFATPDDYFMAIFASGCYTNSPSPYMVFTHFIYGKFLSFLYYYIPNIEWYSILQYGLGVVSFNFLLYYLISYKIGNYLEKLSVILLITVQLCILIQPNFTITAAELSLVSVILLKQSKYFMSIVFFVVAFLIRSSSAFIPYMILLPLIVVPIQLRDNNYMKTIYTLLAIIVISYGLKTYNQFIYNENPSWKAYMEYNSYRGFINDNPSCNDINLTFFHSKEKENEYELLTKHWISDGNILSISDLEEVTVMLKEKQFKNLKKNVLNILLCYGWLGLSILLVILFCTINLVRGKHYSELLILHCSLLLFIVANLYMMSRSFVKERVTICFLFSLLYVVCVIVHRNKKIISNQIPIYALVVLFIFSYSSKLYAEVVSNQSLVSSTKRIEELMDRCVSNKVVFHNNIPISMNVFHLSDNVISKKIVRIGWPNKTPHTSKYYKGFISHTEGLPFIVSKESMSQELFLMNNIMNSYYHQKVLVDTLLIDDKYAILAYKTKSFSL